MDINRKQILRNFLDTIAGISDKEYQLRVWIKGEGPEVDDFTETVCHFFQPGEEIVNEYRNYELNDSQHKILKEFYHIFETFVDSSHPYLESEFINTPEWDEIVQMAKKVLEAFEYKK